MLNKLKINKWGQVLQNGATFVTKLGRYYKKEVITIN